MNERAKADRLPTTSRKKNITDQRLRGSATANLNPFVPSGIIRRNLLRSVKYNQ
jgi:hypothetical protein